VKKTFFAAHKRVLIKIIPHHNESIYKFELSHLHLALAAFCSAILLAAFFIDHIAAVRAAQSQVKVLQTVNSSERLQLVKFSKQTTVMMHRLHELQKENQEIRRLTSEVVRKHLAPRPQSARLKAPAARPVATVSQAPSLWQRIATWVSAQQSGSVSFASEATQLTMLDVELNRALAQSRIIEAQARQVADAVRAREVAHARYLDEIPSIWPTDGYVSSGFGYRSYPDAEFHPGLDIVNDYGASVYATAAGIVTTSGWDGGYGYEIKVDHGNGYVTMYGHNSRLLVGEGQYVHKGQQIALIGATGFATGPHVHYEVIRYGQPVDPTPYLNGIPTELANADPY